MTTKNLSVRDVQADSFAPLKVLGIDNNKQNRLTSAFY